MPLPSVIREPKEPATACVIWLHGLGADGHDFAALLPQLRLPPDHRIRFIFPHAPTRPITLNGGMEMPGWYDIYGLDRNSKQDETGIRETTERVHALIAEQIAQGIASENIMLAGFSQGGAIALFAGLTCPKKLGGIMALSTYLPIATVFARERHAHNHSTPVLLIHGTQDYVVPLAFAEIAKELLTEYRYPLTWQTYPMAHSVCPDEILLIHQWILKQLKVEE